MEILLLLATALAASTIAGVAGFGGAAVLLPVLVALFGVRDAIPILTVAQLVGNASRVWLNRRELDKAVLGWFTLGAVPFAIAGGLLFAAAPLVGLTRLLGAFLIGIVVWRHAGIGPRPRPAAPAFAAIGAAFSFLSALIGSVGPLMAPFFLAYGLVKGAYIGTEAAATVVMHVVKLLTYTGAQVISTSALLIGLALGPAMVLGSWLGKRIVDRLPPTAFVAVIEGTLLVAGAIFLLGA